MKRLTTSLKLVLNEEVDLVDITEDIGSGCREARMGGTCGAYNREYNDCRGGYNVS